MRLCCAPVSADPPVRPLMHELSAVIRISQLRGKTSQHQFTHWYTRFIRYIAPVSADPPVPELMHELSAVIRISQLQGTTSEVTSNGGLGSPAKATVNKAGHDLVVVFAGYKLDTSFELS
ncbi:hypothetical protein WA026_007559 [Henosepilachna vigintioctopunctata]|uniref:Uncharacterized protein n=1 Tax=Henosepilachna vigintioctopunctata TaxID=420089 RepID=A0AAW1UYR1_9CUCU